MAPVLPSSLGRYEVLEELGKGAMGVVYLAKDPLIGRLVALKTFRAAMAMHGAELVEFRARFMREAQSAGILSHPNIVTIHDVVDSSDGPGTFIAMEYVQGTNLKEVLLRGEPMSLEQVVDIVSQVGEALDYAHSKGVIHRDIKPANIILDPLGQVKITDFGIARLETSDLTHEGQLLGTPNYMAPERILGKRVDHRTDLFSLGVVIYEMLTRQKPFQGENLTMVSHRIVYEPFTPPRQYSPGLPAGVVRVLERCLEKEPEQRFSSAGELVRELRLAASVATGSETRATPRRSLTPPPMPILPAAAVPPALPAAASSSPLGPPPGAEASGAAALDGAPPVAGVSGRSRLRAGGRAALILGTGAALGLLLVSAVFGWLSWREPRAAPTDRQQASRAAYRPHLQQARAELDAGRPENALVALSRAQAVAPDDPDLERMEERVRTALAARQTVAEQQAQRMGLLQGSATALAAGDPERAAELARQVLALLPDEPQATALLARADEELARRLRRESQQARREPSPQPRKAGSGEAAASASVAPGAPAVDSGEVLLRVDFFTELPEGVLTIYAGPRKILGESFSFYKRSGIFRSEPRPGRIEAARRLPPGPTQLRVYVALPREAPVVRTLDVQLVGGTNRLLRIRFDRNKQLDLALE